MQDTVTIRKNNLFKRKIGTGDLIEQAKTNAGSFSAVYRSYTPRVYRYVYARVGNHQDAEDITAQVFEAVLRGLKKFDGQKNFSAWVFTIAHNKVVDSYRAGGREASLEVTEWLPAEEGDPVRTVLEQERLAELLTRVGGLAPDEQELLRLRFAAGLKYEEIGEVVGKNTGAVKMSIRRLVERLHAEMEHDNE